jgi:hypothetical protein
MSTPKPRRSRWLLPCVLVAVAAFMFVLAPIASAAPPNDNFANRATMPSAFWMPVEGSDVGATAEPFEYVGGQPVVGEHSVWWEWEAPETSYVGISTCGTAYKAEVAVFVGEQPSELRRVTPEGAEHFNCEESVSFHAVAGTKYEIAIGDGSGRLETFKNGESRIARAEEGVVALRIWQYAASPSNDNFESARSYGNLGLYELPDGTRVGMINDWASNWGATRQPGEPIHAGAGAGASVWYSFKPTESGLAYFGASNGSEGLVLAIYTGSSLATLTPVASSSTPSYGEPGRGAEFTAEAGQEYKIAIDGVAGPDGKPWMGVFHVTGYEKVFRLGPGYDPGGNPLGGNPPKSVPQKPAPAAPQPTPPSPTIRGRSIDAHKGKVTFRFADHLDGVHYRCKLDTGGFRHCSSPTTLRRLAPGKHVFKVVAHFSGGSSSKPAVARFMVPAARHR